MDDSISFYSLVVPVVTAIIAGVVTLVVTVLAKEQKTSEFRQSWIDGLRSDVAELAGSMETVIDSAESASDVEGQEGNEFLDKRYHEIVKVQTCAVRIRLRLNPAEHSHILEPLRRLVDSNIDQSWVEMLSDLELVIYEVQMLLKGEWERVKRGEPAYVNLKRAASCTVKIGALFFVFFGVVWISTLVVEHFSYFKVFWGWIFT